MELLSDSDRKKLELLSRKTEKETIIPERKKPEKRVEPEPFEEEPLKVSKLYLNYKTLLGSSFQKVCALSQRRA
jgi:hypothetical protein